MTIHKDSDAIEAWKKKHRKSVAKDGKTIRVPAMLMDAQSNIAAFRSAADNSRTSTVALICSFAAQHGVIVR
jgi:hypothetical protein